MDPAWSKQAPMREAGPTIAGWNLLLDKLSALELRLGVVQADSNSNATAAAGG